MWMSGEEIGDRVRVLRKSLEYSQKAMAGVLSRLYTLGFWPSYARLSDPIRPYHVDPLENLSKPDVPSSQGTLVDKMDVYRLIRGISRPWVSI